MIHGAKVGRLVLIGAVLVGVLWVSREWIARPFAAVHMRSVAKSISEWGVQHRRITTEAEAKRAESMMDYIESYYVPGPGYRGTAQAESALAEARLIADMRIRKALHTYYFTRGRAFDEKSAEKAAHNFAFAQGWRAFEVRNVTREGDIWSVSIANPLKPGSQATVMVSTNGGVVGPVPEM